MDPRKHINSARTVLIERKDHLLKDFICGGVAGAVSRSAVAPLERLKIMYMCGGTQVKNSSVLSNLKAIWTQEGMAGFFRGNGANVVRIFPFSAIQLSSYPIFKSIATDGDKYPISPTGRFWSGVASGIISTFITYPLDFIRCRLSVQTSSQKVYNGVVHGLIKVAKDEGFLTLYKGLWPTLFGIIPYAGIQLSVYDLTKDLLLNLRNNEKSDQIDFFVAGAWAGLVAQTAAFPIELLRRRLQVQGFEIPGVIDNKKEQIKSGFIKELVNILKHEGFKGLYRGLVPNYLKIVPAAGVNFLVFEQAKLIWNSFKN